MIIRVLLITLSSLLIFGYSSVAQQRYIDLQPECLYPKGTYENGTRAMLRFNGINHGPDALVQQDSVWYILYVYYDGQNQGIIYQGPLQMPSVPVGSKFLYRDNYSVLLYFPDVVVPKEVDFCVKFVDYALTNSLDTIRFSYSDTNASNDVCCQTLTILPIPNSVNSVDGTSSAVQIYPNPSNGRVSIVLDKEWNGSGDIYASVFDITGRMLLQEEIVKPASRSQEIKVDWQNRLPAGMYVVQIKSENFQVVKKLWIQ
jgi:hypothetical protein